MFSKDLRLGYLLTFYQELLDEHSRGIMKSYYEDDLSLAEIAEGVGISRQGVRHIIKRAEEQLLFLDEKLHLAERFSKINSIKSALSEVADELRVRHGLSDTADRLDLIAKQIADND